MTKADSLVSYKIYGEHDLYYYKSPLEIQIELIFEKIEYGLTIQTEEIYTSFNPGYPKIQQWIESITKQDIITAINKSYPDPDFKTDPLEVLILPVKGYEFKLYSVSYITAG